MKAFKDIVKGGVEGLMDSGTKLIDTFIASPDEKIKAKTEFRTILQDYEIKMSEQAMRELELQVQERSNARAMQIAALNQSSWLAKHYLYLLATVIIIAAIGFGIALMYVSIPEENRRTVEMFFDAFLFAGALMVLQFFFGSSAGSKQKTDHAAINEQMKTLDDLTMTRFEKKERKRDRRANEDSVNPEDL